MSSNNSTPDEINELPSGHLRGQATALAAISIRVGVRTPEEATAWADSIAARPAVEGQLQIDNLLSWLALQGALGD